MQNALLKKLLQIYIYIYILHALTTAFTYSSFSLIKTFRQMQLLLEMGCFAFIL